MAIDRYYRLYISDHRALILLILLASFCYRRPYNLDNATTKSRTQRVGECSMGHV